METLLCTILASNRFLQNVVLICDREQVEVILGLENIDPHYKLSAIVQYNFSGFSHHHYVKMNKMAPVNKTVFQIVIASKRPKNYC
jgi:hypothetical protein